jgi:LacI family transcriptional regulator
MHSGPAPDLRHRGKRSRKMLRLLKTSRCIAAGARGKPPMGKVTLRIIAEETGLSKFAVSRALAGKSGVSAATRARVTEVAERLGYRRGGVTSNLLGAIFDENEPFNGEFYVQILGGVQREAQKLGYSVRLHWTHSPDDLVQMAQDCAGLLIVGRHDAASVARAHATGTPVVHQGWLDPLQPVDWVGGTDHEAGAAVAAYVLARGHREIVYVHGDDRLRGRRERLNGLRQGLEAVPGTAVKDLTWPDDSSLAAELDRHLATGARPTVYFCAHDGYGVTVISHLLGRGLRIPEDVSVIGFGDFSPAQQIRPALTTVKVFGTEFGIAAVRLLDARIRHPDEMRFPIRFSIPNRIVERASVGRGPAT